MSTIGTKYRCPKCNVGYVIFKETIGGTAMKSEEVSECSNCPASFTERELGDEGVQPEQ